MSASFTDEIFMQRAIELARLGTGYVAPNPRVGCVVVYNNEIIGEGWHRQYGHAHAEVNAIASVKNKALLQESTVYVTLEPCAHYGKTPPCSLLLVESKVKRVVIGTLDPFALVAGKGLAQLEAAGIATRVGVLESECKYLNRRFFTFLAEKRPYIILKWAQSADGFMAPAGNAPYWISSSESRLLTHRWRASEAAILVGARTVLADDPELTTRLVNGPNPLRLVLTQAPLPTHHRLFDAQAPTEQLSYKEEQLAISLPKILNNLYERNVQSVLVEGGAATLKAFLESGTWDEIRRFTAPRLLSAGLKAPELPSNAILTREEAIGGDTLGYYIPQKP